MTVEELLRRAYGLAMTPLPMPGQIEPEAIARLKALLSGVQTPTVGGLPKVPQWMIEYSRLHGLERPPQEGPK